MRTKLVTGTITAAVLTIIVLVLQARSFSAVVTPTKSQSDTDTAATSVSSPAKTITYCVDNRGDGTAAELPELKEKLATVYADSRGWSLNGQVAFKYVTSGCDFVVWMVSSDQMSSFGAICDSYWNCEVEGSVVVNMDRWLYMTPSWIASNYGGVEEYRTMLINHETGHMLGFEHAACPGSGQPAPVMMQQSISLDGCTFNIWPLPSERATLSRKLQI